ncbi:MAG: hypothetical protein PHV97_00015, partial [Candidatus Omnitrophica bacterium]|nr:hypothetical protein [Candidatus Omnitrophota bacterium]
MISWQTHSFKPWLRTVAFLTVCVFTFTSVVWDGGINKAYAAAANPSSLTPVETFKANAALSLVDRPDLPDSYGTIKSSFKGNRDAIVIAIQDAHINEEAQRNIANILRYFSEKYQLGLVNLEGASGELYTELFSFFPNKDARRNVADYFLKEGRLTGPEYLAIVEKPAMTLYGVEDKELYQENRAAYVDALQFKGRDEKILAELNKVLEGVSRFVFPEEMRELIRRRAAFQEGGPELVSYVRYLVELARKHNIALDEYPGMHSLIQLVDLEKQVDFDQAENETDELINDLKRVLSREKLSRFLTNTVHFRMKKMKRAAYYGYLQDEIQGMSVTQTGGEDLNAKYSNVIAYIQYMKLYDAIDVSIFDEIEFLEKTVKNKLFANQEQVQLDHILRIYDVYCKMFDFTLTKQDAEFYYTYQNEFKSETFVSFLTPLMSKYHFTYGLPSQVKTLDQDLPRVERFYKAALERDQVLIERAVEKTFVTGQKISAIVTGGFHTPGIEKYLREKDLSYIVVAPRITKAIDEKKESALYDAALRETPLPIEKVLSEAFLQPKTGVLNDPRFQLAAEHLIATLNGDLIPAAQTMIRMMAYMSVLDGRAPAEAVAAMKADMAKVSEQAKGKVLLTEVVGELGQAVPYKNAILLPISGDTKKVRIIAVVGSEKSSEVKINGLTDRKSVPIADGKFFITGIIDSDLAPADVQEALRKIAPRTEVKAGPAAIEKVTGRSEVRDSEEAAAQEAAIKAAQLKSEQERIAVALPKYLEAGFKVPESVDLGKTENLTPQETAFRRLLLNRNFEQKLAALKDVGAEGLSQAVILRLLLRSSAEMIRQKIPALRAVPGVSINTVTVSFSMAKIRELATEAKPAVAETKTEPVKPVVVEKPVASEVKPVVLAAEKLSLNAAMKQILEKHKGQPVSTMKGLPKILFGANTQTLIARIRAEFGYDDADMALLAEITGLRLDASASRWWHVYTQLEKAYASVINFKNAQAAEAKKAMPEGASLIKKVGIRIWRAAKWVVMVGPHLLNQFFFGFYIRKISFYWLRSVQSPMQRELSLDVLTGAMLDAAKPVSGVRGFLRQVQDNNGYQLLDRIILEPFVIPTLQFIQRRWKLAVFGAIGAGLVTLFLPAGIAGASLGGSLGLWMLHATAGVPVLGIATGAFVHAFTVSSFINTAILSFLLTVPSFSAKYANAMTDRVVSRQLQALKGIKSLDYMAVRQLVSQVVSASQLTPAQKLPLLQELQAILPSVRYKTTAERTLVQRLLDDEMEILKAAAGIQERAPPVVEKASLFQKYVLFPLLGSFRSLGNSRFYKAWGKTTWGMMTVGAEIALLAGGYQPGELGAAQYIDKGISQLVGHEVSIVSHPVLFVEHNAINWGHQLLNWAESKTGVEISSVTMRTSASLMNLFGKHTEAGDLALQGWSTSEISQFQYAGQQVSAVNAKGDDTDYASSILKDLKENKFQTRNDRNREMERLNLSLILADLARQAGQLSQSSKETAVVTKQLAMAQAAIKAPELLVRGEPARLMLASLSQAINQAKGVATSVAPKAIAEMPSSTPEKFTDGFLARVKDFAGSAFNALGSLFASQAQAESLPVVAAPKAEVKEVIASAQVEAERGEVLAELGKLPQVSMERVQLETAVRQAKTVPELDALLLQAKEVVVSELAERNAELKAEALKLEQATQAEKAAAEKIAAEKAAEETALAEKVAAEKALAEKVAAEQAAAKVAAEKATAEQTAAAEIQKVRNAALTDLDVQLARHISGFRDLLKVRATLPSGSPALAANTRAIDEFRAVILRAVREGLDTSVPDSNKAIFFNWDKPWNSAWSNKSAMEHKIKSGDVRVNPDFRKDIQAMAAKAGLAVQAKATEPTVAEIFAELGGAGAASGLAGVAVVAVQDAATKPQAAQPTGLSVAAQEAEVARIYAELSGKGAVSGPAGVAAVITERVSVEELPSTIDGLAQEVEKGNKDLAIALKNKEIANENLQAMNWARKWFTLDANFVWRPLEAASEKGGTTETYEPIAWDDAGNPTIYAIQTREGTTVARRVDGTLVFRFETVNLGRQWATQQRAAELQSRDAEAALTKNETLRTFYEDAYEVALLNEQIKMADGMIGKLEKVKTKISAQPGVSKAPEAFRIIDSQIGGVIEEKEKLIADRDARLAKIKVLTGHGPDARIPDPQNAFTMENVNASMKNLHLSRSYIEARILAANADFSSAVAKIRPAKGMNAMLATPEISFNIIPTFGDLANIGIKADLWLSNQDFSEHKTDVQKFEYEVRAGADKLRVLQNQIADDLRQLERLKRDHQRQLEDWKTQQKVVTAMEADKGKTYLTTPIASLGAIAGGQVSDSSSKDRSRTEGEHQPIDFLSANINELLMESQVKGTEKEQELIRMRINQADEARNLFLDQIAKIREKHPRQAEYILKTLQEAGVSTDGKGFGLKTPSGSVEQEDQAYIDEGNALLKFAGASEKNAALLDKLLFNAAEKDQLAAAREKKDVDILATKTSEWVRIFAAAGYGISFRNVSEFSTIGLGDAGLEIGVGVKWTAANVSASAQKDQTRLSKESAEQYFENASQRLEAAVRNMRSLLQYQSDLMTTAEAQLKSEQDAERLLKESVAADTKARGLEKPRDILNVQLAAAELNVHQAETKLLATKSNYAAALRSFRELVRGADLSLDGILTDAAKVSIDRVQTENILDPFPGMVGADGAALAPAKIQKMILSEEALGTKLEKVQQELAHDAASEKNKEAREKKDAAVKELQAVRDRLTASANFFNEVLVGGRSRGDQYHSLVHATEDFVEAESNFLLSDYLRNSGSLPKFFDEFEALRLPVEQMAAMPDIDNMLGIHAQAWNLRMGIRREVVSVLDGGVAAGYFWNSGGDWKLGVGPFWKAPGYAVAEVVDRIPWVGPWASRPFYNLKERENKIKAYERDYRVIAQGACDAFQRFKADQQGLAEEYRNGLELLQATDKRIAYEKAKIDPVKNRFRFFTNRFTSGDRSTLARDTAGLERWNEQRKNLEVSIRDQEDRLFLRGIEAGRIKEEFLRGKKSAAPNGDGTRQTVLQIAGKTVPVEIAKLDQAINRYLAMQQSRAQLGIRGSSFNDDDALFQAGVDQNGSFTDQTLYVRAQFYFGELIWNFEGAKRDSIDKETDRRVKTVLEDQKSKINAALNKYEAEKALLDRLIPEEKAQVRALVERAHALKEKTLEATDQEKTAAKERQLLRANRILEAERAVLEARSNFYKATGFVLEIESAMLGGQTDLDMQGVKELLSGIETGKLDTKSLSAKSPEVLDAAGAIRRLDLTRGQIMTRQLGGWVRAGVLDSEGKSVLGKDVTAGTSIRLWGGEWWPALRENKLLQEKTQLMNEKQALNFQYDLWTRAYDFESTSKQVKIASDRLDALTRGDAYAQALQNVLQGNQGLDYFKDYLTELQNAQRAFNFAYYAHRGAQIALADFLARNGIEPKDIGLSLEGIPAGKVTNERDLLVALKAEAEASKENAAAARMPETGAVIRNGEMDLSALTRQPASDLLIDDKIRLYPALQDEAVELLGKMGIANPPENVKILFANALGRVAERHNLLKTLPGEALNVRWIKPLGEFYVRAAEEKMLAKSNKGGTLLLPGDKFGNLFSQDWTAPVVMSGVFKETLWDAGVDFGTIGFADFFARIFDMILDDPELMKSIGVQNEAELTQWVEDLMASLPKTKALIEKIAGEKSLPLNVNDPYEAGNIMAWSVYAKLKGVELTEKMLADENIRAEVGQMLASYNFNKLVSFVQERRMEDFSASRPASMAFYSMLYGTFDDNGNLTPILADHTSQMKIRAIDESLMRIQILRQIPDDQWVAVGYVGARLMHAVGDMMDLSRNDEDLIKKPGAAPARAAQRILDQAVRGEIYLSEQEKNDLETRKRANLDEVYAGWRAGFAMGLLDDFLSGASIEGEAERAMWLKMDPLVRLGIYDDASKVIKETRGDLESVMGRKFDLTAEDGKDLGIVMGRSIGIAAPQIRSDLTETEKKELSDKSFDQRIAEDKALLKIMVQVKPGAIEFEAKRNGVDLKTLAAGEGKAIGEYLGTLESWARYFSKDKFKSLNITDYNVEFERLLIVDQAAKDNLGEPLKSGELRYLYELLRGVREDMKFDPLPALKGEADVDRFKRDAGQFFADFVAVRTATQDAGKSLVAEVEGYTSVKPAPDWMKDADRKNMLYYITGKQTGKPDREGLKDREVEDGEAIYKAAVYMREQGRNKEKLILEEKDKLFLQSIYMASHKNADGSPAQLDTGDLYAYLAEEDLGFSRLNDIGGFLKVDGRIIDQENELVAKITKVLGPEAAAKLPRFSRDQRFGFAVRMHETGKDEKALEDWFSDAYEVQRVAYQKLARFLDPEVMSSVIKQVRKEQPKLNPVTVMQMERNFDIVFRQDPSFKPLGVEGDTVRRLLWVYNEVEERMPDKAEQEASLAWWRQLAEGLKIQSPAMTQGEIMAVQREFSDRLAQARRGYMQFLAPSLYERDSKVDFAEATREQMDAFEQLVAPKIMDFLVNRAAREAKIKVLRDRYNSEKNLMKKARAGIEADRAVRIAQYKAVFADPEQKAALGQKLMDAVKNKSDGVRLSGGKQAFLMSEMKEYGYSLDEILVRYFEIERPIELAVYGRPAETDEEKGIVSAFSGDFFKRWGFASPEMRKQALDREVQEIGKRKALKNAYAENLGKGVPEYKLWNTARNAQWGGLTDADLKNWQEIYSGARDLAAQKNFMIAQDKEEDLRLQFFADAILKLGLSDLPKGRPVDRGALDKAAEREFSRLDQEKKGRSKHWLKGATLADPAIRAEIVKNAVQRKMQPYDLKVLVDRVQKQAGWLAGVSEDARVKPGQPKEFFRQTRDQSTVTRQIDALSETDLALYRDEANPDSRKRLGILEILRKQKGDRVEGPGTRSKAEVLFFQLSESSFNAAKSWDTTKQLRKDFIDNPAYKDDKVINPDSKNDVYPAVKRFYEWPLASYGLLIGGLLLIRFLLGLFGFASPREKFYKKGRALLDKDEPHVVKPREIKEDLVQVRTVEPAAGAVEEKSSKKSGASSLSRKIAGASLLALGAATDLLIPQNLMKRYKDFPGTSRLEKTGRLVLWTLFHAGIVGITLTLVLAYGLSMNPIVYSVVGGSLFLVLVINILTFIAFFYLVRIIADVGLKFLSWTFVVLPFFVVKVFFKGAGKQGLALPTLPEVEAKDIRRTHPMYVARMSELATVLKNTRRTLEGLKSTPPKDGTDPLHNMQMIFDAGTADAVWPRYQALLDAAYKGDLSGLTGEDLELAKMAMSIWDEFGRDHFYIFVRETQVRKPFSYYNLHRRLKYGETVDFTHHAMYRHIYGNMTALSAGDPAVRRNYLISDKDNPWVGDTARRTSLKMSHQDNQKYMMFQPWIDYENWDESLYGILKGVAQDSLKFFQYILFLVEGRIRAFGKFGLRDDAIDELEPVMMEIFAKNPEINEGHDELESSADAAQAEEFQELYAKTGKPNAAALLFDVAIPEFTPPHLLAEHNREKSIWKRFDITNVLMRFMGHWKNSEYARYINNLVLRGV